MRVSHPTTTGRLSSKGWLWLYRRCGLGGFLLLPVNLIVVSGRGGDVLNVSWVVWTIFGLPWAIVAFGCLLVKDSTPQHRVFRLGLVLGFATWVAPVVTSILWIVYRAFGGLVQ